MGYAHYADEDCVLYTKEIGLEAHACVATAQVLCEGNVNF